MNTRPTILLFRAFQRTSAATNKPKGKRLKAVCLRLTVLSSSVLDAPLRPGAFLCPRRPSPEPRAGVRGAGADLWVLVPRAAPVTPRTSQPRGAGPLPNDRALLLSRLRSSSRTSPLPMAHLARQRTWLNYELSVSRSFSPSATALSSHRNPQARPPPPPRSACWGTHRGSGPGAPGRARGAPGGPLNTSSGARGAKAARGEAGGAPNNFPPRSPCSSAPAGAGAEGPRGEPARDRGPRRCPWAGRRRPSVRPSVCRSDAGFLEDAGAVSAGPQARSRASARASAPPSAPGLPHTEEPGGPALRGRGPPRDAPALT